MLKIKFWNWENKNNQGLCELKQIKETEKREFPISGTGIIYRS